MGINIKVLADGTLKVHNVIYLAKRVELGGKMAGNLLRAAKGYISRFRRDFNCEVGKTVSFSICIDALMDCKQIVRVKCNYPVSDESKYCRSMELPISSFLSDGLNADGAMDAVIEEFVKNDLRYLNWETETESLLLPSVEATIIQKEGNV